MAHEHGPAKPRRRWIWLIPTGCLVLVLLCGGGVTAFVYGIFGMMKSCDAYKMALERVQKDPAVAAELGTPIKAGWYVTGNVSVSGAGGSASIAFPVTGPEGRATVYVEAMKTAGQWQFRSLAVQIKGSGQRIDLLQSGSNLPGIDDPEEAIPGADP